MEMRRKDRQLTQEEAQAMLENAEYGVLSTVSEDGSAYGVPMSFAYKDNVIYMHGSNALGHKKINMLHEPRACFTVIGSTELMPEKFGTKYASAIAFGNIEVIEDSEEKQKGIEEILKKYSPEYIEGGVKYIAASFEKLDVFKFTVTELTAKARKQ